ncbi:MAG TPA: class I SAM-dependent methyltransferase [Kofleriaceae bacterium]
MTLVLELTSTRLFAYIGSSHATSTALSVALLGLGLGAAIRLRLPQRAEPPRAALGLAAALLFLAGAATLGVSLPALVALSLAPFSLAGVLVSDAYASRGSSAARSTYAMDLLSAAAGCLIAPRLIGPLSPIEIMLVLGVVCCALAALLVEKRRLVIAIVVAQVGMLMAGRAGALPDGPLDVLLHSGRHSEKAIVEAGSSTSDVLDSQWSPLGRLDVRRVPHDHDRLGIFTDGMSPTYLVNEAAARTGAFEETWGLLMSLPYRALRPEHVLVLGAGAGASVWLARKYGASRVDAVEVSPAITAVLARWKELAGDVYGQPGVHLFIADARRFLADSDEHYDLIELALALTGNVHAQAAGMEAHLYTVEAVQLFLRHLTPTGTLVLIHSDPGNAFRQLLTVLAALEANGIPRDKALDGIAVLRDERPGTAYRYELIVRASPMPLEVVDGLDIEPAELLWGPGDPPERRAQLLDPKQLGATARDDFSPVHDDRPYFFQNTKGLVATALAEPGRLWVLVGALVLVVVLLVERRRSFLDTALAVEANRTSEENRASELGPSRSFVRPGLVAMSLGAAYLCVELALIQRFTLAAGGTLYAVSFVLFCLLAWSAAGALLLGARWRRLDRGVTWACVAAAVAVGATALATRDVAWLDAITSDAARMGLIALLLAPIGLALGGPFPTLLARHGDPAERIASLWAVNGAASVAGGVLGVLALRVYGATDALVLAAVIYAGAAVVAPTRAEASGVATTRLLSS